MRHRCRHSSWTPVAAVYQPSTARGVHAKSIDKTTALRMVYGITTITQRCNVCGWVEAKVETGRVSIGQSDLETLAEAD